MSDITININEGNNQILPNATETVQNFTGDRFAEKNLPDNPQAEEPLPETNRLLRYINKENLPRYLSLIGECRSATELGKVVVQMQEEEPRLMKEEIVKGRFISLLLPFAKRLSKGTSIGNIRARINDALANRPKQRK